MKIRIKCTLHGLLAKTLEREFSPELGELSAAVDYYTRCRAMGYEPVVIEGREHFPQLGAFERSEGGIL